MAARSPILVLGLGNPLRGDDGAGRAVTRALGDLVDEGVEICEQDGEPAGLLESLDGRTAAILVDCCISGAAPGTVRRFDVSAGPLPAEMRAVSSHGIGIASALELARALNGLPPLCRVYTIEGAAFEVGTTLSPAVAAGVAEAATCIRDDLASLREEARHA